LRFCFFCALFSLSSFFFALFFLYVSPF
jgi:hypothetical protein